MKFAPVGIAVPFALLTLALSGCGQSAPAAPRADESTVQAMRTALGGGKAEVGPAAGAAKFQHAGGFVTVKGRVKFTGAPPERPALNVDKDTGVCAPNGAPLAERLVVSADGGVANVVLYLETEAGRDVPIHDSAKQPDPAKPTVLDQKACIFHPHVFAVHTAAKSATLKNSDSVSHNTNIVANKGTPANPTLGPNQSSAYELKAEEPIPIPVSCGIHPWMLGYMLPRSNGYFAVTGADGKFEIPNLPTGDRLSLVVWHESAGGKPGYVKKMKVTSPGVALGKKGLDVKLENDKPLDLEIEVDAATFSR